MRVFVSAGLISAPGTPCKFEIESKFGHSLASLNWKLETWKRKGRRKFYLYSEGSHTRPRSSGAFLEDADWSRMSVNFTRNQKARYCSIGNEVGNLDTIVFLREFRNLLAGGMVAETAYLPRCPTRRTRLPTTQDQHDPCGDLEAVQLDPAGFLEGFPHWLPDSRWVRHSRTMPPEGSGRELEELGWHQEWWLGQELMVVQAPPIAENQGRIRRWHLQLGLRTKIANSWPVENIKYGSPMDSPIMPHLSRRCPMMRLK